MATKVKSTINTTVDNALRGFRSGQRGLVKAAIATIAHAQKNSDNIDPMKRLMRGLKDHPTYQKHLGVIYAGFAPVTVKDGEVTLRRKPKSGPREYKIDTEMVKGKATLKALAEAINPPKEKTDTTFGLPEAVKRVSSLVTKVEKEIEDGDIPFAALEIIKKAQGDLVALAERNGHTNHLAKTSANAGTHLLM